MIVYILLISLGTVVAPLAHTIMTKTPKNGSSSSTPTPGGGPASVGTAPPPSVGSTKSEPIDANNPTTPVGVASAGGGPGTPHSLPENSTSLSGGPGSNPGNNANDSKSDNLQNNQNSTLNGGTGVNQSASNNDGLHCDSNNPNDQPGGGGGPQGGPGGGQGDNNGPNQGHPDGLSGSADQNSNNEGAQIKQEDVKPNALNSGTPGGMGPGGQQNNTSSVLPPEFDGLGDFPPDSKDGGKQKYSSFCLAFSTLKVTKIQSMFSLLFYEQRRELRFSLGQLMMVPEF